MSQIALAESAFGLVRICRNPVFIIGAERSGTTILALALGEHSQLWYSCEGHFFPGLFEPRRLEHIYERGRFRYRWIQEEGVTREEFLESLGMGINALFTSRSGGKRWIEKTPQNTLMVGALADMYPGALFLHILRDGRRVVHSMTSFLAGVEGEIRAERTTGGRAPKWAEDFRIACATWRDYVQAAMSFASNCPDRCLTVRNEDLVADAEECFSSIFDFLGVCYENPPIDYFRSNRINSSFIQGAPELLSDPWKAWTPKQKQIFVEEAGAAMLEYGLASAEELRQMESGPAG